MVDISLTKLQVSPPDRRLLAQFIPEPKLVRFFETLSSNLTDLTQADLETILQLIIDAAELAQKAQGTSNQVSQALSDLSALIQSIPERGQDSSRRLDEIESMLIDFKTPIFPDQTPPFAPVLVNTTTAYAVSAAPAYQPITVRANAVAGGFTVTLPSTPILLQQVNVKKVDASANVVTISAGGSTIDGAASIGIGSQYTNMKIQFNGATWDVL